MVRCSDYLTTPIHVYNNVGAAMQGLQSRTLPGAFITKGSPIPMLWETIPVLAQGYLSGRYTNEMQPLKCQALKITHGPRNCIILSYEGTCI